MKAKKIATWIVVPLMFSIFILDIITVVLCNRYCARYEVLAEKFDGINGDDRIHFLNTSNSDCILLESNGKFALIDSGEGNSNPRRTTEYKGYEEEVLTYIKKVAADEQSKVNLDFILATHYHYDHVGNFHAILTDENIQIKKAYLKEYNPDTNKDYEYEDWEVDEIYTQIISDTEERGIERISKLPNEPFEFGDFILQFYNTENSSLYDGKGENAASVGVKVSKNGKIAFLAADITASTGLEQALADEIGDVDLLKIGHHGYYGSSSMGFLRKVKPEISIVTNQLGKIYPNVKWNLTMCAKTAIFASYDSNGIIANFTDSGEIVLTNHAHNA